MEGHPAIPSSEMPPPGDGGPILRVLVVEDKLDDRDRVAAALEEACSLTRVRCEPLFVNTYEDAYVAISTTFFDLLLVDLVLHGGLAGDPEGWEGLWLLQDLAEMGLQTHSAVVILSAFGTVDIASLTLSEFKALKFWNKDKDAVSLGRDIASLVASLDNFGLTVEVDLGSLSWEELVGDLGRTGHREPLPLSTDQAAFELEHLVRRLFADSATSVDVERLVPGRSAAGVLRVVRYRDSAQLATAIVKYGPAADIRDEADRYSVIREFTEGHRLAEIRNLAMGRFIGAIHYSLLGTVSDEFWSFREFFERSNGAAIVSAIEGLFGENCALWYARRNRERVEKVSLSALYEANLGYSVEAIEQAFAFKFGQFPHERFISFIEVPRRLPHPVAALRTGEADLLVDSVLCPTHGDLHGDNLLVHRNTGQIWLIDFADAGYGHWARDFASLECAIKFQYTPALDLGRLYELEDALQWEMEPKEGLLHTLHNGDEALDKSLRAIGAIRSCARRLMDPYPSEAASREYFAALYYTSLNYLRFHWRLKKRVRKNQILMAAGIALERFTRAF